MATKTAAAPASATRAVAAGTVAAGAGATTGVAVAVALLFLYINYMGASETGRVGAVMTLFQTLFLLVIGVIGVVSFLPLPI